MVSSSEASVPLLPPDAEHSEIPIDDRPLADTVRVSSLADGLAAGPHLTTWGAPSETSSGSLRFPTGRYGSSLYGSSNGRPDDLRNGWSFAAAPNSVGAYESGEQDGDQQNLIDGSEFSQQERFSSREGDISHQPFQPQEADATGMQPKDESQPGETSTSWQKILDATTSRRLSNPNVLAGLQRDPATQVSQSPSIMQRTTAALCSLWTLLQRQFDDAKANPKLVCLGAKAGLAASLVATMCVLDDPFAWLTPVGIWAVVTVDLVFEANIGTSLSKGINRVLGTLCAGLGALLLSHVNDHLPRSLAPIAAIVFVFFGGAIPMYYRFRPPFKDRWNYAVSMSMITFHMLLLSNYRRYENIWLPLARFIMIMLGFVVASIVNLSLAPIYAGDSLHALASKNLEAAATVLERCVCEYSRGTVFEHVPNIASGKTTTNDKIYEVYHNIVMSDGEVDRLLAAVAFEPAHGKFFQGYPWAKYDELMDALRYLVYDIIALDSCLRAEIQAPLHLRSLVEGEMKTIGTQCAQALRLFAADVKSFQWSYSGTRLQGAEMAALQLQYKISKNLTALLHAPATIFLPTLTPKGSGAHTPQSTGSQPGTAPSGMQDMDSCSNRSPAPDPFVSADNLSRTHFSESLARTLSVMVDGSVRGTAVQGSIVDDSTRGPTRQASMVDDSTRGATRQASMVDDSTRGATGQASMLDDSTRGATRQGSMIDISTRGGAVEGSMYGTDAEDPQGASENTSPVRAQDGEGKGEVAKPVFVSEWMERQESLARNWDRTLENITSLSLVKFVSLLLEIVAKMSFVIEKGESLAVAAKFTMAPP